VSLRKSRIKKEGFGRSQRLYDELETIFLKIIMPAARRSPKRIHGKCV
jgi:hypothetical protein